MEVGAVKGLARSLVALIVALACTVPVNAAPSPWARNDDARNVVRVRPIVCSISSLVAAEVVAWLMP